MKSTQAHFLEQLDDAFADVEVLATWSTSVASNVGTVSLTDRETGALLGSIHLNITHDYATAGVKDITGRETRVTVAFSPGALGGRVYDSPTGIDKIVTCALDADQSCTCEWHPTARIAPRDEQYGNSLCLFHGVHSLDVPIERERITDMAEDR